MAQNHGARYLWVPMGGGASQLELAGLLRLPATRAAVKRGALRQSRIFGNRGKRRDASRRRLRGHGRVIVASKSGDRRRGASRRRRGAGRDRRSIRLRGRRARGEVAAGMSLDRPGGHLRLHLPSKAPETPPVDIPPFSTLRLDLLLDLLLRLLVRVRHLVHPFSLRINPQGRVCGTRVRCESSRAKRVWSRDARSDRRCRRSQRPTSFTACRIVPRRIREPHGDTTVRTEVIRSQHSFGTKRARIRSCCLRFVPARNAGASAAQCAAINPQARDGAQAKNAAATNSQNHNERRLTHDVWSLMDKFPPQRGGHVTPLICGPRGNRPPHRQAIIASRRRSVLQWEIFKTRAPEQKFRG